VVPVRLSYKYLTVVVDHETGRLVWVAAGRGMATSRGFFDALGPDRCALQTHVSADGANWIGAPAALRRGRPRLGRLGVLALKGASSRLWR
jgi:transposase